MQSLTGDVTIEARGQRWRLRLDMNALCHFEAQTGQPPFVWLTAFEGGAVMSALQLRAMVHAMLQHHHGQATLAEAGTLLDDCPDLLLRVIAAALPRRDDLPETGAAPAKKAKAPSRWRRFIAGLRALGFRPLSSGP